MIREPLRTRVERAMGKPIDALAFVDDVFLSIAEIATKFGISYDTVWCAQNSGELPYCVFGHRKSLRPTRRSPKRAVLAWAASRLIHSGAA